jgi:alpha-beta hydrolase superfamily lysophospholipase
MPHRDGRFSGTGSQALHYQCWEPDARPRAIVAVVHGFGEHGGRYGNVVRHLVPRGYAVYAFDHRGHGRSPGRRGHINAWSEFRGDVREFLSLIRREQTERPVFLLGHSLGGLIAIEYVLRERPELNGLVVSNPLLTAARLSPVVRAAAAVLAHLAPSVAIKTGLDAAAISRDPAVVQQYRDDVLVHSTGTPRLSAEINAARKWTCEHAADLQVPFMMILGGADRLVPPAEGRRFFASVTLADKELKEYHGAYHEPHNDIIAEQVMTDLARWLEAHLA